MDEVEQLVQDMKNLQGLHTSANSSDPVCVACDDTGWIWHEDDGHRAVEKCRCLIAKEAERRIRNSGLSHVVDNWTMTTYTTGQDWQKRAKDNAMQYVSDILSGSKPWLYIGGAVGSGKSHLATAVCGELLSARFNVRYLQWLTDARRLKSYANEAEEYDAIMDKYIRTEILYIDDLFKAKHGKEGLNPTDADVRLAFELLNGRYAANRPVIITSEWMLTELMEADEGTFSRVFEKSKAHKIEIKRDTGRNYRIS